MYAGITKTIESDATGATAAFHRVEYYSVDLRGKQTTAVINGYVSQDTYNAGKQALTSMNVQVPGVPADGADALVFVYQAVTLPAPVADPANPMPVQANVFAGAQLVAAPAPVAPAAETPTTPTPTPAP